MGETSKAIATNPRLDIIFPGLALFWSLAIVMLAGWNCWQSYRATIEIARATAYESYSKDLLYRRWGTLHGGVYVPVTPETPPNPYLAHIPERDISTPSGRKLTLLNPSYMTREVLALGEKRSFGAIGHLASLTPLNPENVPDDWEKRALKEFEQGKREVTSLAPIGKAIYFRFMQPMITESGCLQCHAAQGYKIGDVRGGLSVSVAWAPFRKALWKQCTGIILAYGALWLIGMLVLYFSRTVVKNYLSARERAEEALQKSEGRYRSLVENANEAILVIQDGNFKFANGKAVASFGYSEQELLRIPVLELIHPEDCDVVGERYLHKIAGDKTASRHTYRAVAKSGQVVWIETSSVLIEWEGRPATLNLITDITERRNAEEEMKSLEGRLQRAEKMEALGQLAGGVAHDLNNVLGVLCGYSELLLMEIPEGQQGRGHVEKILQSTQRGAAIIQDLLTLARRGVAIADVINLNSVVEGFLNTPVFEKMKEYHELVTFKTEYDQSLLNIKGSFVHLEKTVMNLLSNAAESFHGKGEVTIRTQSCYLDKAVRGYDEVKEGDYAVLSVSDTGMGILPEDMEKIFEPFYTKKTMGRSGTGLGLAIVWGTVKDHNGYIDIQTQVDGGTTFTLYFPATREELSAPLPKTPMERYMGKGETVLLVDDIAEQREVASGLLAQLKYRVNVVSSGEEAVEWLSFNKADIIVMDMIMLPGIDGLEAYKMILESNPQQKAIIVSGFSETDRVEEARKLGAGVYVKKPYTLEKIGIAIREELDKNS
ncbi:MAG: ATP-binding response regulator [Syntrophales bacterium]